MTIKEAADILLNLSYKRIRREESKACQLAAMKLTEEWQHDRERANPEA